MEVATALATEQATETVSVREFSIVRVQVIVTVTVLVKVQ